MPFAEHGVHGQPTGITPRMVQEQNARSRTSLENVNLARRKFDVIFSEIVRQLITSLNMQSTYSRPGWKRVDIRRSIASFVVIQDRHDGYSGPRPNGEHR